MLSYEFGSDRITNEHRNHGNGGCRTFCVRGRIVARADEDIDVHATSSAAMLLNRSGISLGKRCSRATV